MDLSFINVPTSKKELLGLLKIAYKAGQNSITADLTTHTESTDDSNTTFIEPVTYKKYKFKQWLKQLAIEWSNAED